MPLPLWATMGAVVQSRNGEPPILFLMDVDTVSARVASLNGQDTPTRWSHDRLTETFESHRWLHRVEPLLPPSRLRAFYRDGSTWEAARGQPVPAWPLLRGMHVFQKETGLIRKVESVQRAGIVRLEGDTTPFSIEDLNDHWIPIPALMGSKAVVPPGTVWKLWRDPTVEGESLLPEEGSSGNSDVRLRMNDEALETLELGSFLRDFEPSKASFELPSWMRRGAIVVNAVSGQEAFIANIGIQGRRPHLTLATLAGRVISPHQHPIGEILHGWVPTGRNRRDGFEQPEHLSTNEETSEEGLEGSFWAWTSPPILFEVTSDTGEEVQITSSTGSIELSITRSDLEKAAVRLRVRSKTANPHDFKWGRGHFLDVPFGPVVIEEVTENEVVLLSPEPLGEQDGAELLQSRVLQEVLPTSLAKEEPEILVKPKKDRKRKDTPEEGDLSAPFFVETDRLDDWAEIATGNICQLIRIDEENQIAHLRWIRGSITETKVKLNTLLEDFRCMRPGGKQRVERVIRVGAPAWDLLFDD